MKKFIIVTIVLLGIVTSASAFYSDNALVNLWNSRRDLQKAFPGDPATNAKLETWAKKYGWKETPDLYNYYPDKAIVEKIVDNKTNDRITALEAQVADLTARLSQTQGGQTTIINQTSQSDGTWRACTIGGSGKIFCPVNREEIIKYNGGNFDLLFYTKYE
jgi:hypothetical protein